MGNNHHRATGLGRPGAGGTDKAVGENVTHGIDVRQVAAEQVGGIGPQQHVNHHGSKQFLHQLRHRQVADTSCSNFGGQPFSDDREHLRTFVFEQRLHCRARGPGDRFGKHGRTDPRFPAKRVGHQGIQPTYCPAQIAAVFGEEFLDIQQRTVAVEDGPKQTPIERATWNKTLVVRPAFVVALVTTFVRGLDRNSSYAFDAKQVVLTRTRRCHREPRPTAGIDCPRRAAVRAPLTGPRPCLFRVGLSEVGNLVAPH